MPVNVRNSSLTHITYVVYSFCMLQYCVCRKQYCVCQLFWFILKRSAATAQKNQREALNAADEVVLLRNANKTLEVKVEKQRKTISHIEEERDHYLAEANEQVQI